MAEEKKVFSKRVYGAVVIKSKLANYNADFTGNPRTLPDGIVYATDKVLKFKIRDYLAKNGCEIFTKTKYKENGNPMRLEEVYNYHFGEISHDKLDILKNLLSIIDVRLFGATFAMQSGSKNDNNVNVSIHGPVQISYGVNRFLEFRDSGMFTDQIGSPYASKEDASQTTLGAQTRSFEAHYVHHFSINPKNLSAFLEQIKKELESNVQDIFMKVKKVDKHNELLKDVIEKRIEILLKKEYGDFLKENLSKIDKKTVKEWEKFLINEEDKIKKNFIDLDRVLSSLTEEDINLLKQSLQVAVTAYDSTSKKDSENELLLWIELNEDSAVILRNFTELIEIKKDGEKSKIDLGKVFDYLNDYLNEISKIEIFYDSDFTEIEGIPSGWENGNKKKVDCFEKLGKFSNNEKNMNNSCANKKEEEK